MLGNANAFSKAQGLPSASSVVAKTVDILSGEVIGHPRVIVLQSGTARLFDPGTSEVGSVVGISTQSVAAGVILPVIYEGEVVHIGWGLTPDTIQYATASGLVSSNPPSFGLVQPVGLALDANTLLLNIQLSIRS